MRASFVAVVGAASLLAAGCSSSVDGSGPLCEAAKIGERAGLRALDRLSDQTADEVVNELEDELLLAHGNDVVIELSYRPRNGAGLGDELRAVVAEELEAVVDAIAELPPDARAEYEAKGPGRWAARIAELPRGGAAREAALLEVVEDWRDWRETMAALGAEIADGPISGVLSSAYKRTLKRGAEVVCNYESRAATTQ